MKKLLSRFKPNKIKLLRKKNGVALPYVIIVSASLFILATTLCAVSASDTVVFSERYNQRQAYITAKSVIEYSKAVLTDDIGTDAMDEPRSFFVTIVDNNNDGEIDGFNNALLPDYASEEERNSYITGDDTRVGYCYVKRLGTDADNKQEYSITIKAIVGYYGAGHTPKTETLTFEGLMCKYSEEKEDKYKDFIDNFNFDVQLQTDLVDFPQVKIGDVATIKGWIGERTTTSVNNGKTYYTVDLSDVKRFTNTYKNEQNCTLVQGGYNNQLSLKMGTLGVTKFGFNGTFYVHQDSSGTTLNGKVANFNDMVQAHSKLDITVTDWVRFGNSLQQRSVFGANGSSKVTIKRDNGGTTSGTETFAVFQGREWVYNNQSLNASVYLEQSAILNVSGFDYIVVGKGASDSEPANKGMGGNIYISGNCFPDRNSCTMNANKSVIIDGSIICEATSSPSGVYITAEGKGAYVTVGGTITSSGAPVVISAIDDTKSGGYGSVYCQSQYVKNGAGNNGKTKTEIINGVEIDVYRNNGVVIYNPQPLENAPQDPGLPNFDNDLDSGNGGGSGTPATEASKEFTGGYYK